MGIELLTSIGIIALFFGFVAWRIIEANKDEQPKSKRKGPKEPPREDSFIDQ